MRRLTLFVLAFALTPAFGAVIAKPIAAPVQLSLPFMAPSPAVASMLPTAALAAAPAIIAPAAAAPTPVLAAPVAAAPASALAPARAKRTTKIDYEEFGRQLAARPGISSDVFRHADAKRRVLRAAGYDALYGAGGRRIPLEDADDVRVGNAFLNVKRAFDRR